MREKKRRKVGLGQSLAAKHWMRIYSAAPGLLVRVRLNYARSSPETSLWHQPLQFADLFFCICSLTCASACICYNRVRQGPLVPAFSIIFVFVFTCIFICLRVNERINLKGKLSTETSSGKKRAEVSMIVCLLNSATDRERICMQVFSYFFLYLYLIHLQISSFCICFRFMCK